MTRAELLKKLVAAHAERVNAGQIESELERRVLELTPLGEYTFVVEHATGQPPAVVRITSNYGVRHVLIEQAVRA